MKIGGPKGPGPLPPEPPDGADKPQRSAGPSFAEVLKGDQPHPSEATAKPDLTEVSDRLKSGEIDGSQALTEIIDSVVRAKVGSMSPAIQEQLRQSLRRLLADDPFLSAKLRRLSAADK